MNVFASALILLWTSGKRKPDFISLNLGLIWNKITLKVVTFKPQVPLMPEKWSSLPSCGDAREKMQKSTAATLKVLATTRCTGSDSCPGRAWRLSCSPWRGTTNTTLESSARRSSQPRSRTLSVEAWRCWRWSRRTRGCTSVPSAHSAAEELAASTKTRADG